MTVNIKINTDTPTGRRLLREVSKYPKVVEIENNTMQSITGEKFYTVNEVDEMCMNKLSNLYGVDMHKLKSKL
ncbi:MAG: hypothetical protein Q7U47_01360 [Paludibacter sp.]|nr:hypothetical protein [Paludibacter sp.]